MCIRDRDETSEETQPVTGTLADGAQSGAATPTGVLPTAALPTATLPGATMATSAGGTDLAAVDGAVEGALTTRPADDVVADQMATVTPDSTDAMDNTMSSQIGPVSLSPASVCQSWKSHFGPPVPVGLRSFAMMARK